MNHASGLWLGFHGDDLQAVIDLGNTQSVNQVAVRFLKSVDLGIYLPAEVGLEVSDDGERYRAAATVKPAAADEKKGGPLVESIQFDQLDARARYVRVMAKNVATIPAGSPAAGLKAWLFADEIIINPALEAGSR